MIVMELMRTNVVTIEPNASAREAVDKMDLYQVSGLPVLDEDRRVIGLISEHDIIRHLSPAYTQQAVGYRHDVGALKAAAQDVGSKKVADLMTEGAVTIDENADAMEAASLMLQHHIKRVPVIAEGKLVGIISRIDICQAVLEGTL